ncbi:MAG: photosynthetic reaction center cytochrome c subunit family protein [Bdellovibrionota bacterium]
MKLIKWSLVYLGILALNNFLQSQNLFAHATSAQKIKLKEEEIRQNMVAISRQLGVTCTECHNMKKLTDDSLKNFQIARDHIKIVEILKLNGMDGKKDAEATCYMCHRGQMKIPYKEKLSAH